MSQNDFANKKGSDFDKVTSFFYLFKLVGGLSRTVPEFQKLPKLLYRKVLHNEKRLCYNKNVNFK